MSLNKNVFLDIRISVITNSGKMEIHRKSISCWVGNQNGPHPDEATLHGGWEACSTDTHRNVHTPGKHYAECKRNQTPRAACCLGPSV